MNTKSSPPHHVAPPFANATAPEVEHAAMGHSLNPQPAPGARDHAAMDHADRGGHGGMTYDMSDPAMAASMERDIRRRFWVMGGYIFTTGLLAHLFSEA